MKKDLLGDKVLVIWINLFGVIKKRLVDDWNNLDQIGNFIDEIYGEPGCDISEVTELLDNGFLKYRDEEDATFYLIDQIR